jgi:hypothetical protein
MSKFELFSKNYPIGVRKSRKTAHGWFFRAIEAGHANLSLHDILEPYIGSCETSTMGRSGFGTVAIVFDAQGNPMTPYNIIKKNMGGGHAAFFQAKELWEGTLTRISGNIELMTFGWFDTSEAEAIMKRPEGLELLKKWVKAHNKQRGVIKLDTSLGLTSLATWRALDVLVTMRPGMPEKEFLTLEFAEKIIQALQEKARTPNNLVYSNLNEFRQCHCGRYLKEGITCHCTKSPKNSSRSSCTEGQPAV